jgi:TatD DNase family protein
MGKYIDAHTHIHFPAYEADQNEVLKRAKDSGVRMITVGTQSSTSKQAVEFARRNPGWVWAAAGFHPGHFAAEWHHDKNEQAESEPEIFNLAKLREIASAPEVVAIGECGLDYFRIPEDDTLTRKMQKEGFIAQLHLAQSLKKPLMIHCRAAFPDLIEILEHHKSSLNSPAGAIHFFSGGLEEAKKLLELGFVFTFGGVVTFSRDYDEVIKYIPAEKILPETDAPYVAPNPYRGKRNEPAYVLETIKKLAELKNMTPEEFGELSFSTAQKVFKLGNI